MRQRDKEVKGQMVFPAKCCKFRTYSFHRSTSLYIVDGFCLSSCFQILADINGGFGRARCGAVWRSEMFMHGNVLCSQSTAKVASPSFCYEKTKHE